MDEDTNFRRPDLESISKYLYTDELGKFRGVVNPHFLASHNITCVGQFIKALLDVPESDFWCGWIGIWNWHSEFGTPRVYYIGSCKDAKTGVTLPGKIEQVTDYNKDWVDTNLVYAKFRNISYVDSFGKVDWLIQLDDDASVKVE